MPVEAGQITQFRDYNKPRYSLMESTTRGISHLIEHLSIFVVPAEEIVRLMSFTYNPCTFEETTYRW
jgi:hypothetical protein